MRVAGPTNTMRKYKEFESVADAEAVNLDAYDRECLSLECPTPKNKRHSGGRFTLVQKPGGGVALHGDDGKVATVKASEQSGWAEYTESKADEWEPKFVYHRDEEVMVTRAELRQIDLRVTVSGDTTEDAVDFVLAQR